MRRLHQSTIRTERLVLRGFRLADAPAVRALAGDVEVARNTLNIPHPYGAEDARAWIASHPDQLKRCEAVTFAVTVGSAEGSAERSAEGSAEELAGAVGLILDPDHVRAELGYWIGRPYWDRGYATEAARAVVAWGFGTLELHRIHATHFPRNPASGAVLRKIGMRHEGALRQHVRKWDEFLDLELYGVLRTEFQQDAG